MLKNQLLLIFVIPLIFTSSSQAFSRKLHNQKFKQTTSESEIQLSQNDRFVMNILRMINSAEITYISTIGNGIYGDLRALLLADLIDDTMASGEKYGYGFTISKEDYRSGVQSKFEVKAFPLIKKSGRLSFYLNESCDIRGAYKSGREATVNDPVLEPCGTSQRSENERLSILSLKELYNAQLIYQSTFGNGDYGSYEQLYNANLVTSGFGIVSN